MHTEDEARKLWCPAVRTIRRMSDCDREYSDTNRGEDAVCDTAFNCIASECAAWRWLRHSKTRKAVYAEATEVEGAQLGYCGLAGKP